MGASDHLLGQVASPATVSRTLAEVDPAALDRVDHLLGLPGHIT